MNSAINSASLRKMRRIMIMEKKMGKFSFGEKIKNLFSSKKNSAEFFDELTDLLIEGDIGAKLSVELTGSLEKICKEKKISGEEEILDELESLLLTFAKTVKLEPEENKTNIFLLLGVNGVGKTTTAAKIANLYRKSGCSVVLAAADTFRAAAEEQLEMHGKNLDVRVIAHQHGSDPAAVVFDSAQAVSSRGGGLVIADTAGRLHNKENLVKELQKIEKIARSKADENCCKKILVVDGTTGQNAVRQAEVFNEAVGIDAVVITKYDSTAKGGMIFSIGKEFGIPVAFVCTGEKYENIEEFNPQKFTKEFLGRAE